MRHFFRRRLPPFSRVLLVESGSRLISDSIIASLKKAHGEHLEFDVVTCYAGAPEGANGEVYRLSGYGGGAGREELLARINQREHPVLGIICSAEPIMTKWKWWLAAKLDAKLFIVNENGDYFWVEWSHWQTILEFAAFRAGLTGSAAVPAILRFLAFPLTLAYLILYAATIHLRRFIRLKLTKPL